MLPPLQGFGVPLGLPYSIFNFPEHCSREVCSVLGEREREEVHSDLDLNLLSVNKSLNGNQETVFLVAFVIIKDEQ